MKLRRPNLEAIYREVDHYIPKKENLQPPRIGISANRKDGLSCIAETYVQAVLKAGGAPVLIPVITDIEALTAIVNGLDGLVMSGGGDINPLYMQEEPIPALQDVDTYRDEYDLILLRLATNRQLPVMGICRGHQILNVAFGGNVYQDIHTQHNQKLLKHSQTLSREQVSHSVALNEGPSKLRTMLDSEKELLVNSFHHQAIKEPAPEFITTATAPDGINEAMEHPEKEIFSVQWHPEAMAANDDEQMLKLFKHHVESSRLFKKAKYIHHRNVMLDSHTDTPMIFPGEFNIGLKEGGKVNLPFMEEGLIDATIMVAYIPQGPRDDGLRHEPPAGNTPANGVEPYTYVHRLHAAGSPRAESCRKESDHVRRGKRICDRQGHREYHPFPENGSFLYHSLPQREQRHMRLSKRRRGMERPQSFRERSRPQNE